MQRDSFDIFDRLRYGEWSGKTGDHFTQSLNLLQILVSILLFCVGYRKSKTLGLAAKLLLIVVMYLFISALWSVDAETSFRRAVEYFFFVIGVIGIGNRLSADEYLGLLRKLVFLSAVASVLLLAISPATVLMADGALRGIFPHKNFLGQVMAAGVLASLYEMRSGRGNRASCVAMTILFVGILVAARSSTSLMTAVFFCAIENSSSGLWQVFCYCHNHRRYTNVAHNFAVPGLDFGPSRKGCDTYWPYRIVVFR